ncbi:MAG: VPLPA-CTERM sorting domain-containing protein [Methylomonas sp.]|nr:VPLPA-CTERM sorting domain-containing protein [Methylomonas sp.]
MIQFKKLAIAGAISASLMGATAAEAHVSYNRNDILKNGNALAGPWSAGAPAYTGNLPATWIANVHHYDETLVVSTANADTTYANSGAPLIIETFNNKWNPANSWGNALDFGLINLEVAGNLTIKVEADAALNSTFLPGFTLWQGWDQGTGNRHGSWNADPTNPGNRGATGISYLGHASTNSSDNGIDYTYDAISHAVQITFTGLAAGNYSLWIGGNGTGNTSVGQQYVASITAAPVPVPGAVWLFGSALAAIAGIRRRKV